MRRITLFLFLICTLIVPVYSGFIFGNYLMGNSYNSNYLSFTNDIKLALSVGLDGFVLDIGPDDWQKERTFEMFSAASQFPSFNLFFCFNMGVIPPSNINLLLEYVNRYYSFKNSFYYDGIYFVSVFGGSQYTFGYSNVSAGWQNVFINPLAQSGKPVLFIPQWTSLGTYDLFQNYPVMDGILSWDAWPTDDANMTMTDDEAYLAEAQYYHKIYMAPIAPWLFTHFSFKNYIAKSELLFPIRWNQIMSLSQNELNLVELIGWNDFGESHYMGPIEGAMPNGSSVWVNGFSHLPWLQMSKYYITAFKTGTYPKIVTDQIYWWFRTSSKYAVCSDPLGKPANWQWADDDIVIFALLTAPAQVIVVNFGNAHHLNANAGENFFFRSIPTGSCCSSIIKK